MKPPCLLVKIIVGELRSQVVPKFSVRLWMEENLHQLVDGKHPTVKGSLEVKLPTIWTDEKAEVGRVREEQRRKKIREENV